MVNKNLIQRADEWKKKVYVSRPEDFIILEGRTHGDYEYPDTLVSRKVTYKGRSWSEIQKSLNSKDSFMLTLRQYVDFLNDLRSVKKLYLGDGSEVESDLRDSTLENIFGEGTTSTAEFLDFKSYNYSDEELRATYHKFENNQRVKIIEPIQEFTSKGISLQSWLDYANDQGLPTKSVSESNLYFFGNTGVALFGRLSDRVLGNFSGGLILALANSKGKTSWAGIRKCYTF